MPPRLTGSAPNAGVVRPLEFTGDDCALAEALREGGQGAQSAVYRRYAPHIQRVLTRILGFDPEVSDLVQEVFLRAFAAIRSLADGHRLKAWLTGIAVFVARETIRTRTRRRWLSFAPPEKVPEQTVQEAPPDIKEAARSVYEVLADMSAEDRIVFALRFIDGMELTEVAEACDVSLATIKRRIDRARKRFAAKAARTPALQPWLEGGGTWNAE